MADIGTWGRQQPAGEHTKDMAGKRDFQHRRDFLRLVGMMGTGGLLAGALGGCGGGDSPDMTSASYQELVNDTAFWEKTQQLFLMDGRQTVLNVDIGSVAPISSHEVLTAPLMRKEQGAFTELASQRARMAPAFGVRPDELALTNGAGAGMALILLGMAWEKSEVIVTTDHEHPHVLSTLRSLQMVEGVEVAMVTLPSGHTQRAADIVEVFEHKLKELQRAGKRVKALLWSSPTYQTGVMLPIGRLVALARQHGLLTICNGAHLPGMLDFNFSALGLDFMASSGHKWQCGPNLTGMVFARNRVHPGQAPLPVWNSPRAPVYPVVADRHAAGQGFDIGARMSYCASAGAQRFDALVNSCLLWDDIGRDKIGAYVMALSSYLREKLAGRWGDESLCSPKADTELLSGLTAFHPFLRATDARNPHKSETFVQRMKEEYGFILTKAPTPDGRWPIRISTPLWITPGHIDQLVDAMQDLARKMN